LTFTIKSFDLYITDTQLAEVSRLISNGKIPSSINDDIAEIKHIKLDNNEKIDVNTNVVDITWSSRNIIVNSAQLSGADVKILSIAKTKDYGIFTSDKRMQETAKLVSIPYMGFEDIIADLFKKNVIHHNDLLTIVGKARTSRLCSVNKKELKILKMLLNKS